MSFADLQSDVRRKGHFVGICKTVVMIKAPAEAAQPLIAPTAGKVRTQAGPNTAIARTPLPPYNPAKWFPKKAAVTQRATVNASKAEGPAIVCERADVVDVPATAATAGPRNPCCWSRHFELAGVKAVEGPGADLFSNPAEHRSAVTRQVAGRHALRHTIRRFIKDAGP